MFVASPCSCYAARMAFRLYNTFAKGEQDFEPLQPGVVRMYTCGPTVYGRPHVGNYASFLMADLLRRWMEAGHNWKVIHVKNITDVGHLVADQDEGEDKIEKQARVEKDVVGKKGRTGTAISREDVLSIVEKYTQQYLDDERVLNLLEPAHRPRATETIPEMLGIIHALLTKVHAYETDDGVYFRVQSFPQYGALSGNTLDKLDAGARVEVAEHKEHPADFALWKKCVGANAKHLLRWNFETGEISESSGEDPSVGFPGWHIECSAMSTKFLGHQIDIHTGGEDNIFPHHECEIAQSECASELHPFARMWVHRRRIQLGEEKMSKSLGNILTIPDIIASGYALMDLRYYLLSVHYRTSLKFSDKGLEDAHKARRKILEWMDEVENAEQASGPQQDAGRITDFERAFTAAMDSDLNTPEALAVIFDCMTWSRTANASAACGALVERIRHTFGCFDPEHQQIPASVLSLVQQRKQARSSKDFAKSDALRDAIHALGYEVRDVGAEQEIKKL